MTRESNGPCSVKLTALTFVVIVQLVTVDLGPRTSAAVDGARVLAVATVPAKSHWYFTSAVLRSLTEAGHAVTAFTAFPDGDRENYTEVDITSSEISKFVDLDVTEVIDRYGEPFSLIHRLPEFDRTYCQMVFADRTLDELMRNAAAAKRFDIVLMESFGYGCISHLPNEMGLPVIYTVPSPMITQAERAITGHVSNPAVVPHLLNGRVDLNAFERRFYNAVMYAYSVFVTACHVKIARLADPKPFDSSPTVSASMIFQNSHYATETSSSVVPNLIPVGGIHLKPGKSVPKDVLDFIEDSPHGVIYFSFGSTIKLTTLPEHVENTFKKVLASLPQRVLWKYEDDRMKDKPNNVMVKKWFPQRDILLHSNIKLFISHGGISGVYEAVDAGVPVLGFPIFYDQPRNIEHLVHNGMAVSLDLLSVTEDKLLNAITELVNDEKYVKNARTASALFKDRPMSPQQSVVYWTEYVIRHRGAPHLKSAGHDLSWYQYLLLDVIAVISIIVFTVLWIVYKVFKIIATLTFKYLLRIKVKRE